MIFWHFGNRLDDDDDDDGERSPDHIDITPIIRKLPELDEIDVTYGLSECGMDFKWSMFGMTMGDCRKLSRGIRDYAHITSLAITRSMVNDKKCRTLCYFLLKHKTLKYLDLSHNSIADSGARAIAKLLNGNSILETLELRDNQIRSVGAKVSLSPRR